MRFLYAVAGFGSLVAALISFASSSENAFGEILGGIFVIAAGVFAVACEVAELRAANKPPKPVARPLLPPKF